MYFTYKISIDISRIDNFIHKVIFAINPVHMRNSSYTWLTFLSIIASNSSTDVAEAAVSSTELVSRMYQRMHTKLHKVFSKCVIKTDKTSKTIRNTAAYLG